jgi:Tfp pilus assembly protein PilV
VSGGRLNLRARDRTRFVLSSVLHRRPKGAGWRARPKPQDGVGLLEVVIAISVLLLALVPAAYLIDSSVQQTTTDKAKIAATELADQELETLNNLPLTALEADLGRTFSAGYQTVAGVRYSVSAYLSWHGTSGSSSSPDLCSSGSPPVSISASAMVSWGVGGQTQKLAEQSVIDPPYSASYFDLASGSGETSGLTKNQSYNVIYSSSSQSIAAGSQLTIGEGTSNNITVTVSQAVINSTTINVNSFTANAAYRIGTLVGLPEDGYLGVQVDGASGSAPTGAASISVGVQSTANGSTTTSYNPDNNGCVYTEETPGDYTITLSSSTSPPYIGPSETQTVTSATQTISTGTATIYTANFDQAASVSFTPSGGVAIAGGTPVIVYNTGIPTSNTAVVIAPGSSATSAYLYPFSSAYSAWYGNCVAEEPTTPATVTVTPGGGTSASLGGLANLTVEPETTGASPVANPSTVTATLDDPNAANDNCALSTNLTLPATSSQVPTSEAAMFQQTRVDSSASIPAATVSTTSGTSVASDTAIAATDEGKLVTGAGVPAGTYVGAPPGGPLAPGASFTLWNPTTNTAVKATGSSTSLTLNGETFNVTATASDGHSTTAVITVTPNWTLCVSGCPVAYTGVFEVSGTAIPVQVS